MKTLVYQFAGSIELADNATSELETPFIRPSLNMRAGLQGVAHEAMEVARPVVAFSVVPGDALKNLEAELKTRRYSIEGGWDSSDFLTDFDTEPTNVSGVLLLNRGVIEHKVEFDGVFKDFLSITNRTGNTQKLRYLVSVYTLLNEDS